MVMPKETFEAQIAYLAKNYNILGLTEAISLLRERRLPRRSLALTFDDGYNDNYEHAFPILKGYRIPATFFVVTDAMGGKLRLWWDEVSEAIRCLSNDSRAGNGKHSGFPNRLVPFVERLASGRDSRAVSQELVWCLNDLPLDERSRLLEALMELTNLPSKQRPDLMLTWEQVRELYHSGMQIGSHTRTHAFVDELGEEQLYAEIMGSVQILQQQLGMPTTLFAYPRGRGGEAVEKFLEEVGIQVAVTTESGYNEPTANCLRLKRLDAGYLCTDGSFDPYVAEAEIHGWFNLLRRGFTPLRRPTASCVMM
jgi:peptidoglycan/xylan/chitin deacetylase (PgdA/CDA1 family)